MKKLTKIGLGLGTIVSTFYWGVLPVVAAGLCPSATLGVVPPGCDTQTVDLNVIVGSVINIVLFLAFVAALVFLIWGGIKWIMSGGDKEGTTKAKESVTAALIGLAVVVASYILINVILQFFGATGGLSGLTFPIFEWHK